MCERRNARSSKSIFKEIKMKNILPIKREIAKKGESI
jgi:hypothetical protein